MLIKISKGRKDTPPAPNEYAELLWTAEHGANDGADVNQIPASVLPELSPTFVVGKWYSIGDAKQLLVGAIGDPANDVWTEVSIFAPSFSSKERDTVLVQIRKYEATRLIVGSAIQFAENLEKEGAVWIRVE